MCNAVWCCHRSGRNLSVTLVTSIGFDIEAMIFDTGHILIAVSLAYLIFGSYAVLFSAFLPPTGYPVSISSLFSFQAYF
jgi:hypothetical protein